MGGDGDESPPPPQQQQEEKSLQDQLLDALLQGQLQEFRRLLTHPRVNPNHRYGKPHFGTCLELACRQRDRHEFVRELLAKVKPNLNKIIPEPLHYAAGRGNADALALLLNDKRTKVNAQDSAGRTALHYVAKSFPAGEQGASYERCLALLLAHPDVDANRANNKGFTPIHEAALLAGKHAVQAFLLHAKQDLDLDTARGHGRTARQAILDKFPELKNSLPENQKDIMCGRRDPQSRLIVELQKRNLENFCQLLLQVDTEGSILADPNYQYGKPINATCLELACKEEDCEEFIKTLLKAGADPNVVNPLTEKSPIHVASENVNIGALKILLDNKTTDINSTDCHGRTALHYIVSRRNGEDKKDQDCLLLLLTRPDINVNIADNNGITPILSAALADNKACVEIMLKLKAEFLDLHNIKLNGEKTVWNVITERYPDLSHLLPNYSYSVHASQPTIHSQLIQHLHKRQTKEFIEKITSHNRENEYVNDGDGSYTFLQYACKHGLQDVVEILLKNGADPNQTLENNRWPPIVISCSRRHHNILMLFLNLPSSRKLDIDATDMKGNTALHYAAKHGDLNSVLALLSHGANIQIKNIFDKPPLPAKAVENLLNQCLKADGKHYPEEDDYKVLFDYEILVPNKIQSNTMQVTKSDDVPLTELSKDDCEIVMPGNSFCQLNAEMEFLFYLSKSEEHRYLLKHPIITSFLHLKWYRVRFSYYVNLMFYILYVIFLNAYILVEVENGKTDQDILMNLANGSLPVRTQFLVISLTILLSYLLLRELVQFLMCPRQYLKNAENILDWSLIILTSLTLFVKISNSDWRKSVTVMTVLLSWAELVLVTGRLPRLSRNIQMLKTVSWTFLRFLIWYSLLIISFGISFYTLFHDAVDKGDNIFQYLGGALFKTFIMMTGEFNSDDKIPFKSTNVTGHILFMLFVFLIAIVLLNLLTGLAVSDTQAIQNNADILSVISRIRLVYEIESMMLGWHHKIFLLGIFRPFAYRLENWVKAISLFPPSVHNKHVCVLPNKGTYIITPHENGVKCKMDVEILGAAMNIIGSRNRATDIDLIKNRLDTIEKCQSANNQILNIILGKLDEIHVK